MKNSSVLYPLMAELGEDWTDPDHVDVFLAWLNDAITEIRAAGPWSFDATSFKLVLSAGARTYDIPAGAGTIRSIEDDSSGAQLAFTSLDRIRLVGSAYTSGDPVAWYVDGFDPDNEAVSIGFYPVPTGDKTVSVFARARAASSLTADDSFPLPADFVRIVRERLRAQYYDAGAPDDPRAARAGSRFSSGMLELRAKYQAPEADLRRFVDAEVGGIDLAAPTLPDYIS